MSRDAFFAIVLIVGIGVLIGGTVYLIATGWNPPRDRCADSAEKLGMEFWRYKSRALGIAEECWALDEGTPVQIWSLFP